MVTTFVRVTVIADDVQLDISLPAHRQIIDFLPDILELLEVGVGDDPSGWVMSTPAIGPLDPLDTLADRQLLDGTSVHLTRAEHAAAPPFVDDVLREMTRTIDSGYARWTGDSRARWVAALASGLILLTAVAMAVIDQPTPAGSALAGLTAVTLLLAACTPDTLGRWLAAPAGVAAALSAWRFTATLDTDARVTLTLAAGALVVAATSLAARRAVPAAPVGGLVGAVLAFCGLAFTLGLSSIATAAWGSLLFLVGVIVAPKLALASSGLLAQLQRSENLELTSRAEIDSALSRGRHIVDSLVWSISLLAVLAAAAIALLGVWQQGLIPLLLGLLLLMRSRSFAHSRHVGPLVAAGSTSVLLALFRLPDWLGMSGWGAIALWSVGAAIALTACVLTILVSLNEVTRAEMRGWLDTLDLFLLLAYVPVVVFAQGIYPYFWP